MAPYTMDDSVRRENRRVELAHRLLSHGVRTAIIIRLTGITRDRLATLRRRWGVPSDARLRGPTFRSVRRFLKVPLNRTEGAALTAVCAAFDLPALEREVSALPASHISLDYGERLCECFEAYRACYPKTQVTLERLLMLRTRLAAGDLVTLGRCRSCRCLMLIDRFNGVRNCWHCDPAAYLEKTRSTAS
jgi:hypothetical protein